MQDCRPIVIPIPKLSIQVARLRTRFSSMLFVVIYMLCHIGYWMLAFWQDDGNLSCYDGGRECTSLTISDEWRPSATPMPMPGDQLSPIKHHYIYYSLPWEKSFQTETHKPLQVMFGALGQLEGFGQKLLSLWCVDFDWSDHMIHVVGPCVSRGEGAKAHSLSWQEYRLGMG